MHGFDWLDHLEEKNPNIEKLPWELKKLRLTYELMKMGMTSFEIQTELSGVISKREVLHTLNKIKIYLKTGRLHGIKKV